MRTMRTKSILLFLAMSAVPAPAACGGATAPLRDWALHRQWRVVRDCDHPERPGRLVEVPWSEPIAGRSTRSGQHNSSGLPAPLVRPGMHVNLWQKNQEREIHLTGTAIEAGSAGEVIAVRAGLRGTTLHGIVRGPASVELMPGRGR